MPIRALVWCHKTNLIVIGCVGGSLFAWNINDSDPILIDQLNNHTVNILRYAHEKIFIGTSDGEIKILEESNLSLFYEFKAHHPIHYETEK
jgi:WD40 repeat protein